MLPPVPNIYSRFALEDQPQLLPPVDTLEADAAKKRNEYWASLLLWALFLAVIVSQLLVFSILALRWACRRASSSYHELSRSTTLPADGAHWQVRPWMGVASSMGLFLTVAAIIVMSVLTQTASLETGIAWEGWCMFVAYNIIDFMSQCFLRAILAPVAGRTFMVTMKENLVAHELLLMHIPAMSTRVDFAKDAIFALLAWQEGWKILSLLSAILLLLLTVFDWLHPSQRHELREEMLPGLRPKVEGGVDAGPREQWEWLAFQIGKKFEAACSPSKMKTACCEDLPQCVLQIIFVMCSGGSIFVVVTLFVNMLKMVFILGGMTILKKFKMGSLRFWVRHAISDGSVESMTLVNEWLDRQGVSDVDVADVVDMCLQRPKHEPAAAILAKAHLLSRCAPTAAVVQMLIEKGAWQALGEVHTYHAPTPVVLDELLRVAREGEDPSDREEACRGLGAAHTQLAPTADVDEVLLHLAAGKEDEGVRAAAVEALGQAHAKHAPTEAVKKAILERATDKIPCIRAAAKLALGKVYADPQQELTTPVVDALLKGISDSPNMISMGMDFIMWKKSDNINYGYIVAMSACQALGLIYVSRAPPENVVKALLNAAEKYSDEFRDAALIALGQAHTNHEPSEEVKKAMVEVAAKRGGGCRALGHAFVKHNTPTEDVVLALTAAATEPSPPVGTDIETVQHAACWALGQVHSKCTPDLAKKIQDALNTAARSNEWNVRLAARDALHVIRSGVP